MATNPTPAVGRDLQFFAAAQSDYTTVAADNPSAGDAVTLLIDGYSFTPAASVSPIANEASGSAYPIHVVEQAQGGTLSLSMLVGLSGTSGTAPDAEVLLTMAFSLFDAGGESTTATGVGSNSGNTQLIPVTSATGLIVGGSLCWYSASAGKMFARRITAVSGTDITVSPVCKDDYGNIVSPASGDVVKSSRTYSLRSNWTDDSVCTLWACWTDYQERIVGFFPTSISIGFSANEVATLSIQGGCYRRDVIRRGILAANINDSVTSVTVATPVGPEVMVDEFYLLIDSEILKVTGVSTDGLTLTVAARGVYLGGGAAASHTAGVELLPYRPTPTTSVAIPSGACGAPAMLDTYLGMTGAVSVKINPGIQPLPQRLGGCQLVPGAYQGSAGTVTTTLSGMLLDDTNGQHAITAGERRETVAVHTQIGNVFGAVMATWQPTGRETEPPVASADLMTMDVEIAAIPASASVAPLYLIIG